MRIEDGIWMQWAGLRIARGGAGGIQVVGGFKIESTSDHRAGPGDSAGIGNAVGPWKPVSAETEAA